MEFEEFLLNEWKQDGDIDQGLLVLDMLQRQVGVRTE